MATPRNIPSHVTRIFQRGIACFKAEDYHRAIQCFDQAIQVLSTDSTALAINLFDSRAAAKEKINDFKGSLADAKRVMDLAPGNPKGYIRAARLFSKIGRFPASVKMFELAISKLNSSPKKNSLTIENIKAELEQVRHQEITCAPSDLPSPRTSRSNISASLPYELFISIVTLFDIPTRLRCMGVCSSWREAILNSPTLWNSLSLTSSNHTKLMAKAQYWLDRLGANQDLETLIIKVSPTWPPKTTRDLLTFLTERRLSSLPSKRRLRYFSFELGGLSHPLNQTQRVFSDVLAFVHLNQISLVKLELQVPTAIISPQPLHSFLEKFPRLRLLKLQGTRCQSLILQPSEDFLRDIAPLSLMIDHNQQRYQAKNHLEPPHDLEPSHYPKSSQLPLETLFLQCAWFTVSEQGPIRLNSLKSISIISAAIDAISVDHPGVYVPAIDFRCFPNLSNLELCRVITSQDQWATVWQSCERLSRLKRLRLEGLPHLINHFLHQANVSPDSPSLAHQSQSIAVDTESILPELEFLSLSCLESGTSYKFLAVFAYQFTKLESLSVAGLPLDPLTEPLLISALQQLPSLVNISLSNTHARSQVIDAISSDRLERLQVVNCTRITFRSLSRLVTRNFSLLDITGCHLISTREMIEWLAQRVTCLIWREDHGLLQRSSKRLHLDYF